MKTSKKYLIPAMMLVAGLVIGWLIGPSTDREIDATHEHTNVSGVWTCSMHPSVRQSEPGQCPICGMALIPVETGQGEGGPAEIKMSETAMHLAQIQTTRVTRGNPVKAIRLNGKVQVDERRKSSQTAHIPGRIEQLLVNFTGEFVQRGQVIAQVYSPELINAQQELFEASKIKSAQPALYDAAREKLKNWKLTDQQIDALALTGKIQERFPIVADGGGIVLERKVNVGDYVVRGAPLYQVADLSRIWILFDVYENDMPWIKKNSLVEFTVQSIPGETFEGKIAFIDPVLNAVTRVASARLEMENPGLRLKPEMFVSAEIKSNLNNGTDIIVPKSAVLWTGERSVVYVKNSTEGGVGFVLHEITLGPSLGDAYIIKEGLEDGMEVVTNGTFTIDAAAQLAGKSSMMNPKGGAVNTGHQHGAGNDHGPVPAQTGKSEVSEKFKAQVGALFEPYIELKDALVQTDAKKASSAAKKLEAALKKVNMGLLNGEAHNTWMALFEKLNSSVKNIGQSVDVEIQRQSFSELSNHYYQAILQFDVSGLDAYYQYCPMALGNQGAYWISKDTIISNPYFGSKMLRCGETKSTIK